MTNDRFLLLKMHPCSEGLSDEVVREISEKCELLQSDAGVILHRVNEPITSVYLVIHGRIKQSLIDIRGNVLMERQQVAGAQVGALAAALGEPSPIQIEVMEPTTFLSLNYKTLFELLRKYLKDSRLEQLPIPVHSVTVDLISGKPIVREEGDSVHAILESINVPVLSKPINRDGRALVDGGIVNNVPANTLVAKGYNFVIAASVTAQIKTEFASNRPDTPTSKMKSASVLQTILRTYIVQNVNMNSVGVKPADFVIQPDTSEFAATEFNRVDEMAAIGRKTALESMPSLKQLLSRVDDQLFANI